jgi:hypothetical protein
MPDDKERFPRCQICREHVALEACAVDEQGQAVHEECYTSHLASQQAAAIPPTQLLG